MIDVFWHSYDEDKKYRIGEWTQPHSLAAGFSTVYFIFWYLRFFFFSTKYFKSLKFLLINLIKMLCKVIKFLFIFMFAVNFAELVWYYGKKRSENPLRDTNETSHKLNNSKELNHHTQSNLGMSLFFFFFPWLRQDTSANLHFDINFLVWNVMEHMLFSAFSLALYIVAVNLIVDKITKSMEQKKISEHIFERTKMLLKYAKGEVSIIPSFFSVILFWCNLKSNYLQKKNSLVEPFEVIEKCVNRYKNQPKYEKFYEKPPRASTNILNYNSAM